MPRTLGGAVLASAAIVNLSLERHVVFSGMVKGVLVVAAAAAALWLVRAGSEARMEVILESDRLRLGAGRRHVELPIREIEALDYDPPLASSSRWLPAVVLIDRRDRRWRIPAAIGDGTALIEKVIERSGEESLKAWAEARRIAARMTASRWTTVTGYLVAGALIVAASVFAWS
jgi:hypothetical protein